MYRNTNYKEVMYEVKWMNKWEKIVLWINVQNINYKEVMYEVKWMNKWEKIVLWINVQNTQTTKKWCTRWSEWINEKRLCCESMYRTHKLQRSDVRGEVNE